MSRRIGKLRVCELGVYIHILDPFAVFDFSRFQSEKIETRGAFTPVQSTKKCEHRWPLGVTLGVPAKWES